MIAALGLALLGLAAPLVLRRLSRSGVAPRLFIAAHFAALLLSWAGVLGSIGAIAGNDRGLWGLCELLLVSVWGDDANRTTVLGAAMAVLLLGRSGHATARWAASCRAERRRFLSTGQQGAGYVAVAGLGTVAATVGCLRPLVVVDEDRFGRLPYGDRWVVLAHERAHVRGGHGLVDAIARCLTFGLTPWPTARLAHAEIRRHLEALADDHVARRCGRRRVASTLARVAVAQPPAAALGASGWPVWRVRRLLVPPSGWQPWVLAGTAAVTGVGLVAVQVAGHAIGNLHLLPILATLCL